MMQLRRMTIVSYGNEMLWWKSSFFSIENWSLSI